MKKMLLTFIYLFSSFCHGEASKVVNKNFDITNLNSIVINNKSGNINIAGQEKSKLNTAKIQAEKVNFEEGCKLNINRDSSNLLIEVENLLPNKRCHVNFIIEIPTNIDIEINNGLGDSIISNTNGKVVINSGLGNNILNAKIDKLKVSMGNGNLSSIGTIKNMEVNLGNGNIDIGSLTNSGDVKAGSAKVQISYLQPPTAGQLNINTGNGNIELGFPAATKLNSNLITHNGKIFNEIGNNKNSLFNVKVHTGRGKISIKEH